MQSDHKLITNQFDILMQGRSKLYHINCEIGDNKNADKYFYKKNDEVDKIAMRVKSINLTNLTMMVCV